MRRRATALAAITFGMLGDMMEHPQRASAQRQRLHEGHDAFRHALLEQAAAGAVEAHEALEALDAYRWLGRVAYHLWRIALHLEEMQTRRDANLNVAIEAGGPVS